MRAIDRGDTVGVVQFLLPEEARLLVANGEAVAGQLRRFGSFGIKQSLEQTPVSTVGIVPWRAGKVTLSSTRTLANVTMVQSSARADENSGPISRSLSETALGRLFQRTLSPSGAGTDSIVISAKQANGRWYVSLANTMGSAWQRAGTRKQGQASDSRIFETSNESSGTTSGVSSGDVSGGSSANGNDAMGFALGAASPEEAVQSWIDSLVKLDQDRLRSLTNPLEATAFPTDAINALWADRLEKLERQFELIVPDVSERARRTSTRLGEQTVVPITVRDANFALTEPGSEPFIAQYHEGCLVILSGGKATKHCGREIPRFGEQFSIPVTKATIDRFVGRIDSLAAARKSLPGIVTVQINQRWFVSPVRTALLNVAEGLSNAKRADIQGFVDDIRNAISAEK